MYLFTQSTGEFFQDSALKGAGWAGQGAGKNNPDMQNVPNIGPLPRGSYSIGPAYHHPKLGPLTMNLTPDAGNEMYGRSSFRIHGASASDPEHSSEGCIVLPHDLRQEIANGADRILQVIE